MAGEEDVRRIALSLPGTAEEGVQFRVDGKGSLGNGWSASRRARPVSRAPTSSPFAWPGKA